MLARIQKSMKDKDQGFTLIELLVVMVIIGILSAIAIPVFNSQRTKARETSAVSDATNIGREVATYFVDNTATPTLGGTAPAWTLTQGTTTHASGRLSTGNTIITSTLTNGSAYCVLVATGTSTDQRVRAQSTGVTKVAATEATCPAA